MEPNSSTGQEEGGSWCRSAGLARHLLPASLSLHGGPFASHFPPSPAPDSPFPLFARLWHASWQPPAACITRGSPTGQAGPSRQHRAGLLVVPQAKEAAPGMRSHPPPPAPSTDASAKGDYNTGDCRANKAAGNSALSPCPPPAPRAPAGWRQQQHPARAAVWQATRQLPAGRLPWPSKRAALGLRRVQPLA